MRVFLTTIFVCLFIVPVLSQEKEIPYTLADRDRLIQVETKMEAGFEAMDAKFEAMDDKFEAMDDKIDSNSATLNARMDRLDAKFDTFFTWGFGMVLGAIFALFGFILWDRRSTIAPVKREQEKVVETLREIGKSNETIREALKKAALW